ncbi:S1/P1 nuclease [Mesoterricola silvestris]|uniref:S1/P1 Nuclease n=1 Tax=Mesoterricola silvestris TaxID=2927979 RepID=A0AA48GST7_9BACT|nr:S1/P1 nuclease [Mesoterricola silvestris]BDU75025.1 hypothetical protein METEAL_41990 [Mesoterricola silvestris]
MRLPLFLLLAILGTPSPLAAWGRRGHRTVAGLALRDLPPGPAAWFKGQEAFVEDHSSDPDHWKDDPLEGPRHFMELDRYPGGVPTLQSEAREQVGPAVFQRSGQAPWVIQDRVKDLVQAFRKGDRAQVAYRTSILSHYVADLHVPLHTVANYDGQMSGQRGLHSRWETGLVDRMTGEPEVRPAALEPNLLQAPWRWLEETNALVPALLADDRASDATGFHGRDKPDLYWMLFGKRQGPVVKEQLARAGQHTAQLILLAWTQAGRP